VKSTMKSRARIIGGWTQWNRGISGGSSTNPVRTSNGSALCRLHQTIIVPLALEHKSVPTSMPLVSTHALLEYQAEAHDTYMGAKNNV